MLQTSALSLGTRKDAGYWSDICAKELSYTAKNKITTPVPTLQQIKTFFAGSEDWLFLGGHFASTDHLYNEAETVKIRFEESRVVVNHPDGAGIALQKNDGFKQHEKIKVLFWGGCDVHSDDNIVRTLRTLFGSPLMIGWRGTTGWEVLYSVMGGFGNAAPHSSRDFYTRVSSNPTDPITVKDAWLDTAKDTTWAAAAPSFESRFSVFMPDGTEKRLPERVTGVS